MKTFLLVLAMVITLVTSYGQKSVVFNIRVIGSVDARVFLEDGTFASTGWTAQLFGGPAGGRMSPLLPTTTFRTGAAAGYVAPPALPVEVPGVAPGIQATRVMRAFNGSSLENSTVVYESNPFTITLGGGLLPPANLIGLGKLALVKSALPPAITSQPLGQTVLVGTAVTLSVTATGTAPLSYQWRFKGADIAGATSATLRFNDVRFPTKAIIRSS